MGAGVVKSEWARSRGAETRAPMAVLEGEPDAEVRLDGRRDRRKLAIHPQQLAGRTRTAAARWMSAPRSRRTHAMLGQVADEMQGVGSESWMHVGERGVVTSPCRGLVEAGDPARPSWNEQILP